MTPKRVAILVDGDNIGPRHAGKILSEAEALGRADVVRVYLGAGPNSDWLTTPGFRTMHAGGGKNAADILLCIDAMEIALQDTLGAFAIATSDGDFSHLALRLRERGLTVLGLGESKAPDIFRRACTEFRVLKAAPAKAEAKAPGRLPTEFDQNIRTMIAEHGIKGLGMKIADLAPKMHAAHGTRISTYPERTWRAYLLARPTLYQVDPRGPNAKVRFLPGGFA